ncbi:hypothetical protein F5Y11DRAFT_347514 [Daldinia sp. FL1419]|nr:hypothetical protein F5Y11DRAFT_347514 [Daldinia sp. FL1419]
MKNFGTIMFLLATAGSYVAGIPAFRTERRAIAAEPVDIAARALELAPRVHVGSRSSLNETENAARSLVVPRSTNSTEGNPIGGLVNRRNGNYSEPANARRTPTFNLKRGNLRRSASNETEA